MEVSALLGFQLTNFGVVVFKTFSRWAGTFRKTQKVIGRTFIQNGPAGLFVPPVEPGSNTSRLPIGVRDASLCLTKVKRKHLFHLETPPVLFFVFPLILTWHPVLIK